MMLRHCVLWTTFWVIVLSAYLSYYSLVYVNDFLKNFGRHIGSIDEIDRRPKARITITNTSYYWGVVIDGVPNGWGKIYHNDTLWFRGFFENGLKIEGKYFGKSGNVIIDGECKNDQIYLSHEMGNIMIFDVFGRRCLWIWENDTVLHGLFYKSPCLGWYTHDFKDILPDMKYDIGERRGSIINGRFIEMYNRIS